MDKKPFEKNPMNKQQPTGKPNPTTPQSKTGTPPMGSGKPRDNNPKR
jgi:hypothetical protein